MSRPGKVILRQSGGSTFQKKNPVGANHGGALGLFAKTYPDLKNPAKPLFRVVHTKTGVLWALWKVYVSLIYLDMCT